MKNFVFHKYRCAQSMPILVVALKSKAKTLCQKRGGVLGEGEGRGLQHHTARLSMT